MKLILLLTAGILVAYFFGGLKALDLDGRILPWMIGLIISPVAGVFAVPWQMGTPVGNQGICITASALKTNGSVLQTMR
jgi:hypothetical protein